MTTSIARVAVGVAFFSLVVAVARVYHPRLRLRDVPRYAAHSWRRRR